MRSRLAKMGEIAGKGMVDLFAGARDILLPPQCPVTGEHVIRHGELSPGAWQDISFISAPYCKTCGLPFEFAASPELICGACATLESYANSLISGKGLDKVRASMRYDDASADLILSLKYADRHDLVDGFGTLLVAASRDLLLDKVDITPVPLHSGRLRQRKFNQAALLARSLADKTGSDLILDLLERHRATPQQQGLSAKARQRNVRSAFRIREKYRTSIDGGNFLLVDDVLTTGATLKECARVLKKAGASQVCAVVLARVVKDDVIAI
ncbi:MAG: ComF family protein [Aquisalinus sp.]|nr:ComF family protein [Aquisalinus sp.]